MLKTSEGGGDTGLVCCAHQLFRRVWGPSEITCGVFSYAATLLELTDIDVEDIVGTYMLNRKGRRIAFEVEPFTVVALISENVHKA